MKTEEDSIQPTALGSDLKFDWNEDLSTLRPAIDDEETEQIDESIASTTKQPLLTSSNSHRTQEEYEELVKQAPNDSHLWIEYMQFYIDQAEIDRARSLAERALANIYYR